jgi:hypothetical protein
MDQKKQMFLLVGAASVGLVLVAAYQFGLFGHSGQNVRNDFATATPTPTPNARAVAEQQGKIESVQGSELSGIKPTPSCPGKPAETAPQKRANYEMVAVFAKPTPTPAPAPAAPADPKVFLPRGQLIPCSLILTIESSSSKSNPVMGYVTQDVRMFGGNGKVLIPAGTQVHALAQANRIRDRVQVSGEWDFVFKNGAELEFKGTALDRTFDKITGSYGISDGSMGLFGKICYTDEYAEMKSIAAAALAGAGTVFQDTNQTVLGNQTVANAKDAGLQGLSSATNLLVQKYLSENDGDNTYVQVPAGKEFYIYTENLIQPDLSSIGAYVQKEKPQNRWEAYQQGQKEAADAAAINGMDPSLKAALSSIGEQQADLKKLQQASQDHAGN